MVIAEIAQRERFDLYGMTSTSPQFPYAFQILKLIKGADPNSRIVLGGPHATMFANLRKRKIDDIIRKNSALQDDLPTIERLLGESDINFNSLKAVDQVIAGEELGIFEAIEDLDKQVPRRWV
jgi:radical SAM superfamily enzyme YgiQ (UPF0313 family)